LALATTPGINLPGALEFNLYAKTDKAKKRKNGDQALPKEFLLYSQDHERMDFTAREDRPEIMKKLLKHYIGAFDPKTGELQIIEARKMVLRGSVRERKATDEAMTMPTSRGVRTALLNCPVIYMLLNSSPFRYTRN
jgi:DNA-directed RNA polymerase I subunit RPA49